MWLCLIRGVIPKAKSPLGWSGPPCQPTRCRPCPGGAVPLQPHSSLQNASGFCCWQGVLGDACSAPAICALGYPLNHGDLHGNPMRPGISVPLCIKQHQLPCNLIVCFKHKSGNCGLEQSKLLAGHGGCSCQLLLQRDTAHPGVPAPWGCAVGQI